MSYTINKLTLLSGGLFILTIISGFLLSSPLASADNTGGDTIRISVPLTCSLSLSETTAHTATVNAGTYVNNIGESNVKATCNDSEGFAIYAIGYSGDTYGNNTLINTENSNYTIATGTATSGATSNWAMKLTSVTGTYEPVIVGSTGDLEKEQNTPDFSNYTNIPSTYTKVVYRNSLTDQSTGANFKTTYAAYVNPTQFTGTYEGKVKYTLVHPASKHPLEQTATSGCINYFANASDAVGTMGCQSVSSSDTTATLLASNFSRSGYGFAGWSDSFDYATNPNAKFYGPQETISFTEGQYSGTNNGLALYAVWVKSQGSLQDASKVSSVCSGLTTAPTNGTANLNSVSALTDERDNQTYAIAKLADGNCWMIENLRLESTADHNTDGSLAQGYNSSFIGLANAESANFSNTTTANSLYSTNGSTTATISGSNQSYRFPRYNNTNTATRASSPTTNSNVNMYSYGNYYTWAAAIADTTYYSSGDHDATSICPTGWKLPLGNTSTGDIEQGASDTANKVGGFSYLDRKMGGTGASQSTSADSLRWRKFPLNFLYSGYFGISSAYNRGSHGYYWSSTAGYNYRSYDLLLTSSSVTPSAGGGDKYIGLSIRCLAL